MVLGLDYTIFASIIILTLIPLYLFRDKIVHFIYPKSDFNMFLTEVKKYITRNHPKVNFKYSIVESTKNIENPEERQILIIENLVSQFCNHEFDIQSAGGISGDNIWRNYQEHNKPIKGRLPSDWARRKEIVWNRDDKRCLRCGKPVDINDAQLALIKKVDLGGEYNFENLMTLCFDCNKIYNSEDLSKTMKYLDIKDSLMQKVIFK